MDKHHFARSFGCEVEFSLIYRDSIPGFRAAHPESSWE